MSIHRTADPAMLKPPAARSAWPAGPVDTSSLRRIALDSAPVCFNMLSLIDAAGNDVDPRTIDFLIVGDVRFVREDRA
jgi:hypothetical protein